jgi:predicted ABC-type sugar transport system permease subunit
MENKKKVFRSRISGLLVVFILIVLIPVFVEIYRYKTYQELYVSGGVALFIIFLFSGMRYIISGEKLYLKMWFIPNGSRNVADIVSVKRSYNLLASPAASLKRLRIHFKTGSYDWLISPVKEQAFIEALKAINQDIDVYVPEKTGKRRIWDWDIYK